MKKLEFKRKVINELKINFLIIQLKKKKKIKNS